VLSGKDGYRIRRPPWFIGTRIMAANRRDREFALLEGASLVGAAMRATSRCAAKLARNPLLWPSVLSGS
jgi:hypothetical protein